MEKETVANPFSHFLLKMGRRLRRRVEIDAEARATLVSTRDGHRAGVPIVGRTVNLSHHGALLLLPEVGAGGFALGPAAGDGATNLMELDIDPGDGIRAGFRALGRVVWLEEIRKAPARQRLFLVGVRFVKLFRRDREALRALIGD